MKYINVKRIFLNIGLTLLAVALGFVVYQLYSLSCLVKTEGTVQSIIEPEFESYYTDDNGNKLRVMEYDIFYMLPNEQGFVDYIMGPQGEYEVGSKVDIYYDKRSPESITYADNYLAYILIFGIPGGLLVFFCRSAFKGYKREYLDRYKNAVWFSVISGIIPIAYWIYYEFIFVPGDEMFAGLGEYLLCISLFIIVPMINIIVWICAAALYCRRCKKKK